MKRRILVELEVETDKEFYGKTIEHLEKQCDERCPFYSNPDCPNATGCIAYEMGTAKIISFKEIKNFKGE